MKKIEILYYHLEEIQLLKERLKEIGIFEYKIDVVKNSVPLFTIIFDNEEDYHLLRLMNWLDASKDPIHIFGKDFRDSKFMDIQLRRY